MKGAVIDLGTNTFGLIVFKKTTSKTEILLRDKAFVHLGEGGINANIITEKALERAYSAIAHFIKVCKSFNVFPDQIKAIGTSALRDAKNAKEFIQKIDKMYQLKIQLIDGFQEAQLVYEGVNHIHSPPCISSCIMDIGGGSTEFTLMKNNMIYELSSFNIGISRIAQLFNLSDPLSEKDGEYIQLFFTYQTKNYFETLTVNDLIGAAGSFETYYLLLYQNLAYDTQKTHLLPLVDLYKTLDYLIQSTQEERNNNIWIADYRKEMIHLAAYQTKWVLEKTGAKCCYFSPAGIKEGVISSYF